MKIQELGLIITIAAIGIGCKGSGEGAAESIHDSSIKASEKIKEGMDNGSNLATNAGAQVGAAAQLTPRIKIAITANRKLNASGNLIDVDSRLDKVTLSGHVLTQELKDLAGKIAQDEMIKAQVQQKFLNDLEVKPAAN